MKQCSVVTGWGGGTWGGDGKATMRCSVSPQNLPDGSRFVCEFVCVTEYKVARVMYRQKDTKFSNLCADEKSENFLQVSHLI